MLVFSLLLLLGLVSPAEAQERKSSYNFDNVDDMFSYFLEDYLSHDIEGRLEFIRCLFLNDSLEIIAKLDGIETRVAFRGMIANSFSDLFLSDMRSIFCGITLSYYTFFDDYCTYFEIEKRKQFVEKLESLSEFKPCAGGSAEERIVELICDDYSLVKMYHFCSYINRNLAGRVEYIEQNFSSISITELKLMKLDLDTLLEIQTGEIDEGKPDLSKHLVSWKTRVLALQIPK